MTVVITGELFVQYISVQKVVGSLSLECVVSVGLCHHHHAVPVVVCVCSVVLWRTHGPTSFGVFDAH